MSLRQIQPLRDWADREHPNDHLWRQVVEIVLVIAETPWAWPSRPESLIPLGSSTEIRWIDVVGTAVTIGYEHDHVTGTVDLLVVE